MCKEKDKKNKMVIKDDNNNNDKFVSYKLDN